MRRLSLFLLLLAAVPSGIAAAQGARPVVAVLPFENGGSYGQDRETFDALRLGLQALLVSELARHSGARLLEPDVVRSRGGRPEGTHVVDAATAAASGKALGATHVVLGAFTDHYGRFRVDARVVDVDGGRIVKVVSNDPKLVDRRELYAMVQSLSARVAEVLGLPAVSASSRSIPSEAVTAFSRGLLLLERGRPEDAGAAFRQALELAPELTEARAALGGSGGS
ncbi:MAG TPA: hypothetical protein VFU00_09970 [Gemmatimonadales bacterium]|nr:hypothetical protein [Gemmatimonadales bacterium]